MEREFGKLIRFENCHTGQYFGPKAEWGKQYR
jgi:hypothetical protein